MENQILDEIKKLRLVIAELIGSSELPMKDRFSKKTLDKAVVEFKKLRAGRREWLQERNIDKAIKGAPYQSGAFIRKEFNFTNYFKIGYDYYYNKKELIALDKALKERNVDLAKYIEYRKEKVKFNKLAQAAKESKTSRVKRQFELADEVMNIQPGKNAPPPPLSNILDYLNKLKEELVSGEMVKYIDIHKNGFAHFKNIDFTLFYGKPIMVQGHNFCNHFNYAVEALTKYYPEEIAQATQ